jgi:hypothetical protein
MFTDKTSKDEIITDLNCPQKERGKFVLNGTSHKQKVIFVNATLNCVRTLYV